MQWYLFELFCFTLLSAFKLSDSLYFYDIVLVNIEGSRKPRFTTSQLLSFEWTIDMSVWLGSSSFLEDVTKNKQKPECYNVL
jgi:hypothetical protein